MTVRLNSRNGKGRRRPIRRRSSPRARCPGNSGTAFADFRASADPSEQHKIMHSQLETPDRLVLMGADTPEGMEYRPQAGVSVSLSGDDESILRGYWEHLSEGGTVTMPLEKAPWGDTFGMCVDRFGTSWMVNVAAQST